ncbi:hypothetical protein PU00_11990 [Hafnia alvei]|uniref:restriction endonuclease subunit S n=1 Tax=Hafnia alvei TaxID=569 RepID=UPI0005836E23|nr:restriction endonuclease subunit S [Hafnia alvei]KID02472.1 hypothetical protein PU00_11990 [Hafnia alvei]
MAVEKLITDHIDIWSSALQTRSTAGRGSNGKIDLYGIKKLRELILELAVRGKLVPQDPNDEPASELLKRIAAEKAELVKQGKIKKQKPLPEISEDEKPFELPSGWEWQRLIELGSWAIGSGFPTSIQGITSEDILMCKVSDMNLQGNEKYIKATNNTISEGSAIQRKINVSEPGTVIFPKIGGAIATNKRRILVKKTAIDNNCLGIRPFERINLEWFFLILNAIDMAKYQSGTSVPAINQSVIGNIVIALPSECMQASIVAKVAELMSLCDQLEQQSLTSLGAHQQLVETLLATLTESQNAEELAESWARISQHFDTLFTTEASIDALKQTILQLAVIGVFIPQGHQTKRDDCLKNLIDNDLKNICSKKNKEVSDFDSLNALKKEIPSHWLWLRLNDIANVVRGGSPRPAGDPKYYDGDIPFLKVADITNKKGKYVEGYTATIKPEGLNKTRYIGEQTVLLSNSGATLGIPAICNFNACFNDGVAAFINKTKYITDDYLFYYLSSLTKWFLDYASRGQGQPNLNTDIIKATWIPVPPLTEQAMIVKTIEELTIFCDTLKSRLQSTQQTQFHLADALTDSALS